MLIICTIDEPIIEDGTPEEDKLTSSFVIFPSGVLRTSKGSFLFDKEAADLVMRAYADHGIEQLPIDYDHGMLSSKPSAESSSAAGWFVPSIDQQGGLVAINVSWTEKASGMLRGREFRHYSPAFDVDMDNPVDVGSDEPAYRITRLVNVALTNLPATKDQIPLVASAFACDNTQQITPLANKETESMHLFKLFGLDNEAEIAQQATQLMSAVDGAKTLSDVLSGINELKHTAAKSIELAQRVASLEAEKLSADRDALIAKMSKEGKAPPSIHGFLRTLSLAQVKSFGNCIPSMANKGESSDSKVPPVTLSEQDEHVLALMPNISREAFIAERKREQQSNSKTKKAG